MITIIWFAFSVLASYTLVQALHNAFERETVFAPRDSLYRIAWRSLTTGYEGHGDGTFSFAEAGHYCKRLNSDHAELLIHWPEEVSE